MLEWVDVYWYIRPNSERRLSGSNVLV